MVHYGIYITVYFGGGIPTSNVQGSFLILVRKIRASKLAMTLLCLRHEP